MILRPYKRIKELEKSKRWYSALVDDLYKTQELDARSFEAANKKIRTQEMQLNAVRRSAKRLQSLGSSSLVQIGADLLDLLDNTGSGALPSASQRPARQTYSSTREGLKRND